MFFLLRDTLEKLPGIGPNSAQKLGLLGLSTVGDLITYYPRRWEDLSQVVDISGAAARIGEKVTLQATLVEVKHFRSKIRRIDIINAVVNDGTGAKMKLVWFNQPYLVSSLKVGESYFFSGKVGEFQGHPSLVAPNIESADHDPLHSGRIIPIYPLTAGISSKLIRRCLKYTLPTIRAIEEILPPLLIRTFRLIPLSSALENIHFPASIEFLKQAKKRLSFEELLEVQLGILIAKRDWEALPGKAVEIDDKFLSKFSTKLDWPLTDSQTKSISEILSNLGKSVPMNRLLLGDVGSGKTIVAAAAIVAATKAGFQAALMAPTEVLANQHYRTLQPLLAKFGLTTTLLTGNIKLHDYSDIASGKINVIIGTHALIQTATTFKKLNLVIVDEQHRFGVRQREQLKKKADDITPHFLSLSATPIPRTLFLSLLSHLDVSILDKPPMGRLPIITRLVTDRNLSKVVELINQQVKDKHKIFVVVPLINEQPDSERTSVIQESKKLAKLFPKIKIGILHGGLSSEQKESAMANFRQGRLNMLIATSVIEVGIDIPDATVIWIKNADRFGLAQLHQLRGRVGRSDIQSYCLIETASDESETLERLKTFVMTNDGEALAMMDLKFRGPGSFFEDQQSGFLKLKLADLTDTKLIHSTKKAAELLLKEDPNLTNYPKLKARLSFQHLTHEE